MFRESVISVAGESVISVAGESVISVAGESVISVARESVISVAGVKGHNTFLRTSYCRVAEYRGY